MLNFRSHTLLKRLMLLSCGVVVGVFFGYNFYSPKNAVQINTTQELYANKIKTSILSINYNSKFEQQDDVRDIPVESYIYDIGYVVYSKSFAERHGYPEKYIVDLDSGMQALEFRMMSRGGSVDCFLNALLDNNLNLDLPEQDYTARFNRNGGMMRFPKQIDAFKDPQGFMGYRENLEDKEFRMNVRQYKLDYYSRNIRLASYDYAPDPNGNFPPAKSGAWSSSYVLESYTGKYYKDLDYISISITCTEQPRKQLERDDASLWIKKKGGDDYTRGGFDKPEQFVKFRLPHVFAKKSAELIARTQNYFFLNLLENP